MTTGNDTVDEIEVPHLKERLWHELAELHAEHRRSDTPAQDTGAELIQRRARRSLRMAGIGAAAAAVLIAGVFTARLVGTGTDGPTGRDADAVLVARVVAATDEALAESVVHAVEEQVRPDGTRYTMERWHDETTGVGRILSRDEQGNPLLDVGPLVAPTVDSPASSGQRVVDHCVRGYVDHVDTGGASINFGAGVIDVRELLADGELVEDGTEVVDGRELIRLRGTDTGGGPYVLLVDPDSYRVVRQRGTLSLGESYATVYDYLPRTEGGLGVLRPPIPRGFTQVEPGGLPWPCDAP